MKKIYLSVFTVLFSASVSLAGGLNSGKDESEIRYIANPKRQPDKAYQAQLRALPQWQKFLQENGTWYVIFNEENARPHRAYGKPVHVFGATAEDKALNFISTKLAGFKIPVSDLRLMSSANSGKYIYVNFNQVHKGIPVLNSRMTVKLNQAGSVVLFGADVFSDIDVNTTPAISADAALTYAQGSINGDITKATISSDLRILPVPEAKSNAYKLVYEATVEAMNNNGVPAVYYTLVDAATGRVIYRQNQVKHFGHKHKAAPPANTDVTITGTVNATNPYNPSSVVPLTNLRMTEGATTFHTDSSGFIGLANTAPVNVTFSLQGRWSRVIKSGSTPTYSATLNPGTNNLTFDNSATIRDLSAYYHVNIVHDYMKTKLPSFTGMDNALTTNVDVTGGNCNAFYNGSSINFYATGNGCNSLAQVGDVVYHEYGHGINDKFYQSQGAWFQNGAMGEGYADIWALGITQQPVLGIGFSSTDPTEFVRRYDQDIKVYPQDLVGEVHADGEIIAGAWWDTGLNMGDLQKMMDLFSETFFGLVTGPDGTEGQVFTDVLIEALQADDVPPLGDNDISNGTPNDQSIVRGFDRHGISLISNATLQHTPVLANLPDNPVTINATLYDLNYPWAMEGVKMHYKVNRNGSWNAVAMTNTSGTNYTATIPAQPQGTIIAYYVGLEDTSGKLSAVQPIAAHEMNPNIPYFILNGFDMKDNEDFDNNTIGSGAWLEGIPGDDATTGHWVVAMPVGSFSDPSDPNTAVQPDYDHTTGTSTGFCAVTGNAGNTGLGLGTNDVDGGKTTLESPVLDLSGYTNPAISYYRWYINNPPTGANPANDFWEVQITNDGNTWVNVERTNISDRSWRRFAFRIADYVTLSDNVKIRFIAEDSLIPSANLQGGSIVEAAIDDIMLYEEGAGNLSVKESAVTFMQVHPNPASDQLIVKFDVAARQETTVEMVNTIGQVVYSEKIEAGAGLNKISINTSHLPAGVYMFSLRTGKSARFEKITIIK